MNETDEVAVQLVEQLGDGVDVVAEGGSGGDGEWWIGGAKSLGGPGGVDEEWESGGAAQKLSDLLRRTNRFVIYASSGVEQKYSYMKHQKFEFCKIPRTWPNLLRIFSFRESEP